MKKLVQILLIAFWFSSMAQTKQHKIIDVHIHSPIFPGDLTDPKILANLNGTLREMDSLNVVFGIANGTPDFFEFWAAKAPQRIHNFILFPCVEGKVPNGGRPCNGYKKAYPDIAWLRKEIKAGNIKGLGEITTEYIGVSPDDPALEPYWALAEEFDIPVAIHLGLGPPNAAYTSNPAPHKSPGFRVNAGNPLLLENVLLKHKKLRMYAMHAGWPMGDEMIYMLYAHPNLYVDTGVLQWAIPRKEYYYYLKRLVDAGYSSRIMFGSDGNLAEGIKAIVEADFLTEQQKTDILYNNAIDFFKLNFPRETR